jgi:hypothetical protein
LGCYFFFDLPKYFKSPGLIFFAPGLPFFDRSLLVVVGGSGGGLRRDDLLEGDCERSMISGAACRAERRGEEVRGTGGTTGVEGEEETGVEGAEGAEGSEAEGTTESARTGCVFLERPFLRDGETVSSGVPFSEEDEEEEEEEEEVAEVDCSFASSSSRMPFNRVDLRFGDDDKDEEAVEASVEALVRADFRVGVEGDSTSGRFRFFLLFGEAVAAEMEGVSDVSIGTVEDAEEEDEEEEGDEEEEDDEEEEEEEEDEEEEDEEEEEDDEEEDDEEEEEEDDEEEEEEKEEEDEEEEEEEEEEDCRSVKDSPVEA